MKFEQHNALVFNEERGVGADRQLGVVVLVVLPLLGQLVQLRRNQQPVLQCECRAHLPCVGSCRCVA